MKVYVNDGKKTFLLTRKLPFNVGDYVEITNTGEQYSTYVRAFQFFWGSEKTTHLQEEHKSQRWKVINIAYHSTQKEILCHIRNIEGKNAIIEPRGLKKIHFHEKNRENVRDIVIYKIPYYREEIKEHDWKDKLWDFYENGKIVKNERRNNEII